MPRLVAQAWPLLVVTDLRGTLPGFVAAIQAIVRRFGAGSATAAVDYYRRERAASGAPGRAQVHAAPVLNERVVESTVRSALSGLYGPISVETTASAQAQVSDAVTQLVLDQGRYTIIDAAQKDKAARGWARVTEPDACSFCLMLAIRAGAGFLYTSRQAGNFRAHDNCRCHVEPVFGPYEPPARVRDAQALWGTATKGRSGADARTAFRQAVEERPVTGKKRVKRPTPVPPGAGE